MRTNTLLLILLFIPLAFGCGGNDEKAEKLDATVMIKEFVKKKLRNPSSADFETGLGGVKKLGEGKYEANSYVDAENGFGGTNRINFHCIVQKEGDTWKVIELTLDE